MRDGLGYAAGRGGGRVIVSAVTRTVVRTQHPPVRRRYRIEARTVLLADRRRRRRMTDAARTRFGRALRRCTCRAPLVAGLTFASDDVLPSVAPGLRGRRGMPHLRRASPLALDFVFVPASAPWARRGRARGAATSPCSGSSTDRCGPCSSRAALGRRGARRDRARSRVARGRLSTARRRARAPAVSRGLELGVDAVVIADDLAGSDGLLVTPEFAHAERACRGSRASRALASAARPRCSTPTATSVRCCPRLRAAGFRRCPLRRACRREDFEGLFWEARRCRPRRPRRHPPRPRSAEGRTPRSRRGRASRCSRRPAACSSPTTAGIGTPRGDGGVRRRRRRGARAARPRTAGTARHDVGRSARIAAAGPADARRALLRGGAGPRRRGRRRDAAVAVPARPAHARRPVDGARPADRRVGRSSCTPRTSRRAVAVWGRSPAMYFLDLGLAGPAAAVRRRRAAFAGRRAGSLAIVPALLGARALADPARRPAGAVLGPRDGRDESSVTRETRCTSP